ncbi:MAG: CaiB/BaiF CoA-transferase family protein [Rubrivivax sp.]|nr:CaiB/BaiF CoA-transferase family protein [Rubrivivax sp.]
MSTSSTLPTAGPLAGVKVLEIAGIGPGPMCGMLLADLGAQVLRLDRVEPSGLGIPRPARFDLLQRGKRQLKVDLKTAAGLTLALALAEHADVLLEGFRPGTLERLGLGPEACLARNPRLVYGRVTGYGQTGPLAQTAGHDLNYIALSGALHAIGREGAAPTPPLNLLGDYAGGSLMLAFGVVSALLSARQTGCGQVVDAAMTEGVAALMTPFYGLLAAGLQNGPRGTNTLDSGAPFYDVYRCADGEYVSVAPIETKFRRVLLERLGAEAQDLPEMDDPTQWPRARQQLAAIFATRTRAQWCALLEGSDACFAPVLAPLEASRHAHHASRGAFVDIDGITQPAPAPRFSATPPDIPQPPQPAGASALAWAQAWGVPAGPLHAAAVRQP